MKGQDPYVFQFGGRIKKLRTERGLSQEGLAKLAGLHRTHTSLIESGKREVRLGTIVALAAALKLHPADLMPKVRKRIDPDADREVMK